MKVLLVNPPTLYRGLTYEQLIGLDLRTPCVPYYNQLWISDRNKNGGFTTFPGEHLGIQGLKSSLQRTGHHVTLINACLERHCTLHQTLNSIKHSEFGVIGFTGPLDVFSEILWLTKAIRELGYTGHITIGHDFATLNHQELLTTFSEFNSVVRAEGEITLPILVEAVEKGTSLDAVKGITFRNSQNKIVANKTRMAIQDLDLLPWVCREDLTKALALNFSASIYSRRGCPCQCSFCTTGTVARQESIKASDTWRKRSFKGFVDEIAYLKDTFGITNLSIIDDLFISKDSGSKEHALSIAEEILARKVNIDYMIDCRIDGINKNDFQLLKASGLKKVFIGAESGSEATLKKFRKGYKASSIHQQLDILSKLGIEYVLGFIMFNPLETIDGLEASFKLLIDLNIRDFELFLQSVRVYPGTDFHKTLNRFQLLSGFFPYFSIKYQNKNIEKIRKSIKEISTESISILKELNYTESERRERLFCIVRDSFSEMILSAKTGKDLDIVSERLASNLINL